MESKNPVLTREFATFRSGATSAETLQGMYDAPGAGRAMTIDDVVVKTGVLFVVLFVSAIVGWRVFQQPNVAVFLTAIVAFGLAMFISFKRDASPVLIIAYSLVEGLFLGAISNWYQNSAYLNPNQGNLVGQAIIGTFAAFAVMLVLYKSGRLRATPRFTKVMTIALVSYLGIAVVSLVAALFGVGGGWGFYGVGGLGLLLCAVGVGLAAFTLVLDFDAIEKGVAAGMPEKESWRAGFGLMVTLIWLYLELLRLLSIVQGGGRR